MNLEGVNRIVLGLLAASAVCAIGAAIGLNWSKSWADVIGYGLTAAAPALTALAGFFGYAQKK